MITHADESSESRQRLPESEAIGASILNRIMRLPVIYPKPRGDCHRMNRSPAIVSNLDAEPPSSVSRTSSLMLTGERIH